MDHLHVTEFGSEEFFRKQRASERAARISANPSTFVLPVGHSRPPNGKRRATQDATKPNDQKVLPVGQEPSTTTHERRPSFVRPLAGFRSKASASHRPHVGYIHESRLVEQVVKQWRALGPLFFSLPNELQVHMIKSLGVRDVLNLRLVCKDFHRLVSLNEGPIVRNHIEQHTVPGYALRLYPLPDPIRTPTTLGYLCRIWHRLHIASKLTTLVCEYVAKDLFCRDNREKYEEFQPQYLRMRRRLLPLLFTIFHFFETSYDLHIKHLRRGGTPLRRQAYTFNPIEQQTLNMYSDETLLKVHQVMPLVLSSFACRLRPPSYVGKIERAAKGWTGDRPSDEVFLAIFLVGGLRQVQRVWQTKVFSERRHAVDVWFSQFASTPPAKPSNAMSKISRLSPFHRKRSVAEVAASESSAGHEAASCKEYHPSHQRQDSDKDLIYHGSLSMGPPMSSISKEDCRLLLPEIQSLTTQGLNVWIPAAEALILERGIVDSASQLRKNTAVLIWLISEIDENEPSPDGLLEEWNPAEGAFHGVRGIGGVWDT